MHFYLNLYLNVSNSLLSLLQCCVLRICDHPIITVSVDQSLIMFLSSSAMMDF